MTDSLLDQYYIVGDVTEPGHTEFGPVTAESVDVIIEQDLNCDVVALVEGSFPGGETFRGIMEGDLKEAIVQAFYTGRRGARSE